MCVCVCVYTKESERGKERTEVGLDCGKEVK